MGLTNQLIQSQAAGGLIDCLIAWRKAVKPPLFDMAHTSLRFPQHSPSKFRQFKLILRIAWKVSVIEMVNYIHVLVCSHPSYDHIF